MYFSYLMERSYAMYCGDYRQNMYIPQAQLNPQMPMTGFPANAGYPSFGQPMMAGQLPSYDTGAPLYNIDVGVSPYLAAGVQPPETPVYNIQFTQGYLRTQIGSKVRVEFLIGTNSLQDRRGTLVYVGISYIIIQEEETDDLLLCDIYSIKFVTFYR